VSVIQICTWCERSMPRGCLQKHGDDSHCPLGPRTDPAWIVGTAIWKDLTDRRGVKNELNLCEIGIQVEIIETVGRKAIEAYERIRAR
jgi:hypothetical protein